MADQSAKPKEEKNSMNVGDENAPPKEEGFPWRDLIVYGVAVLGLIGFGGFIVLLLGRVELASELEWTRSVYLFSAVEAVAFAAVGFLFGKEVHRQQAEKAEEQVSDAQEEASKAKKEAAEAEVKTAEIQANAWAVKKLIDTKIKAPGQSARGYEAFGPQASAELAQADLQELREFVREVFPD